MKRERLARALYIIQMVLGAVVFILFLISNCLPQGNVLRKIFWVLVGIGIVLLLCVKLLDKNGTISNGTDFKNKYPKIDFYYRKAFQVIFVLVFLVALFEIIKS